MNRLFSALIIFALCFAPLPAYSAATKTIEIDVAGRKVRLSIWEPAKPQGVIIFSHGAGGSPDNYDTLLESWKASSFLIVAPLHTDSP
jgi:predicted dienelactone hydrolase